jgi:riboflavin kinase
LEDNTDNKPKPGRNVPHKAVVNVGFSPTFEGQENPEKIVEAHLMFDTEHATSPLDPPDFYHETMRLQLIGFLRPEIKFPSFPALIAQIRQDVRDAEVALEDDPYRALARDDFLRVQDTKDAAAAAAGIATAETATSSSTTPWIGSSGGDATASWEIQAIGLALENVRAV